MKLQFDTRTMLLAVAVVAISLGGVLATVQLYASIGSAGGHHAFPDVAIQFGVTAVYSPLWMPVVFVAFMVGRRAIAPWAVFAFAAAEVLSMGVAWVVYGVMEIY